jgi:hypothetical protein
MKRLTGAKRVSGGTEKTAPRLRETGVRLYADQIEKLDMIVTLANGREDRSRLIREGIDQVIAQRLGSAVSALATRHAADRQ